MVLFKLVFIQTLDGLKSIRKTYEKIKVDLEYRWFLGIPLGKETPHYSIFSQNYIRRFKDSNIFEEIFVNHDSKPFINRMNYIEKTFNFKIKEVGVDSGYDTLEINLKKKNQKWFFFLFWIYNFSIFWNTF